MTRLIDPDVEIVGRDDVDLLDELSERIILEVFPDCSPVRLNRRRTKELWEIESLSGSSS